MCAKSNTPAEQLQLPFDFCCDCGTPISLHSTRFRCHQCAQEHAKALNRKYYAEHKEEWREKRNKWRHEHPDRLRELRQKHEGVQNPRAALCAQCQAPLANRTWKFCPACQIAHQEQCRLAKSKPPTTAIPAQPVEPSESKWSCSRCRVPIPPERKHRYCIDCARAYQKEYEVKNLEQRMAYRKAYTAANIERIRTYKQTPEQQRKAAVRGIRNYYADLDKSRALSKERQARRKTVYRKGKATRADYMALLAAADGRCALCKTTGVYGKLHVDHIIPIQRGGAHHPDNLQALCKPCNQRKYNKLMEEL